MRRALLLKLLMVAWCAVSRGVEPEADSVPLHRRIDQLIAAKLAAAPAPPASDAEFVRRVYLDLAGRVPAFEETRNFLVDEAANKRAELINRLLSSPEHVQRLSQVFHVMLMERMGDQPEWQAFLRESFAVRPPNGALQPTGPRFGSMSRVVLAMSWVRLAS